MKEKNQEGKKKGKKQTGKEKEKEATAVQGIRKSETAKDAKKTMLDSKNIPDSDGSSKMH